MVRFKLFTTSIVVMAIVILATSCKKTPTEETFEPKLLLSSLSVSIVPGGTENITITAKDEHNLPLTFSVECEDKGIATVTKTDSTITVTGKNLGTTNVMVSCGPNFTKTFPVEVYNAKVLGIDELIIKYVDEFEYRWCSLGGGGDTWCTSFYHPVTTDGFHALGSFSSRELSNPNGKKSIVVVKAKPGSDALKPPVDYDSVWNTWGSGIGDYGSLWNPVPPAGYKALGTVAQRGFDKPSLDDVVCVREDLTIPAALGNSLFRGDNGRAKCMVYPIDPPDAGPHDSCYLKTETFIGTKPQIPSFPVLYILKIKLPMKKEGPVQTFAPRLTGYDTPPDETAPLLGKEIYIPWSLLKDSGLNPIEQYKNSPLYRLARQSYYVLEFHNYNQTSELQTNSWSKTVGVTSELSIRLWASLGLSLSYETGVSFGTEAKFTVTLSTELGYEKQYNITQLQEKTITVSINTPPRKAAALWRKVDRFIVKRHNGTKLETVETWDVSTESYVTDEYPHE